MMIAKEIASHVGLSKRMILHRAQKESWPFILKKCVGGQRKEFPLSTLPFDIRKKINTKEIITEHSMAWVERLLCSLRTERYSYYFLFFVIGFFGKVIIDIINR